MAKTLHVFDFLKQPPKPPGVCVLFGDEPFFKRLARRTLIQNVFGKDDEPPFTTFEGGDCEWRDVADELATVSLFGGGKPRVAVIYEADSFVTKNRAKLEQYAQRERHPGILVLEVETWQSNTRLYKLVDKNGLQVECRPPRKSAGKRKTLDEKSIVKWLIEWAKSSYQAKLSPEAAETLFELAGPEFGVLDQEIGKLSLLVEETINRQHVLDIVGGWKARTVWELIDDALDGNTSAAITQLDLALQSGEHPLALFGQIAWSLRRFAAATQIYRESERRGPRKTLRDTLIQAGFPHWNRKGLERAEKQLRQLGRTRGGRIYQSLLETDLALKSTHSSPPRARLAVERFLAQFSAELRS